MFGLTDQALQLVVASIIMTASIAGMKADNEDLLTTATAQYMSTVQQANNTYVTNNLATLGTLSAYAGTGVAPPTIMSTTVGTSTYTTTVQNPLSPTVADLIALKLLPTGFGAVSPMKQTFTTYLTPTNCPGSSCAIQGTMRTNASFKDKSGAVRSDMVADVVAHAGNDAGASYSDSPGTITGFRRSWNIPNPVGGTPPAMLVMRVGSSSGAPCTVFTCYTRAGLYPLTAALQGGGQDAVSLDHVYANQLVTQSGNGVAMGNTYLYGDTVNSAVRQDGTLYIQNRAGTAGGSLNTANATVSNSLVLVGTGTPGASCNQDAALARNSQTWGGLVLCSGGAWQAVGTGSLGAYANAPCSTPGTVYTNATNMGYVCNNNYVMTQMNQTLSNFQTITKVQVQDGSPWVSKPTCPNGGTAVVDIIPQSAGVNVTVGPPYESVVYRMNDSGTYWVPQITLIQAGTGAGESGNDLSLKALAVVQCQASNGAAAGY